MSTIVIEIAFFFNFVLTISALSFSIIFYSSSIYAPTRVYRSLPFSFYSRELFYITYYVFFKLNTIFICCILLLLLLYVVRSIWRAQNQLKIFVIFFKKKYCYELL